MITVNHDPVLWCSSCLKSWDKDAIAVRVAHITICDKCAQEAADVAQRERGRRRLIEAVHASGTNPKSQNYKRPANQPGKEQHHERRRPTRRKMGTA